jgi:ribosomal protein L40E
VPLTCRKCGATALRLRAADDGAEAQCVRCGAITPNAILQSADLDQVQLLALEMIRQHGKNAARESAKRAGNALAKGHMEEMDTWLAVIAILVGIR